MYHKLRTMYPDAPDGAWKLQDDSDGEGPRIVHWDEGELGPQPSDETIAAVDDAPMVQSELAAASLISSDKKMARVAEDVIDILITNGVLTMADLPQSTQSLITGRKAKRAQL